MRRIDLKEGDVFSADQLERTGAFDAEAMKVAIDIVDDVRHRGDDALRDYAAKFDHVELDELEVTQEEIDEALKMVDEEFLRSVEYAADNISDFHKRQVQQSWFDTRADGAITGQKITPLDRVGIYVPGGRAQYPSTVLMNAIPAGVAGVGEIIMCTPPQKDGKVNPYTLAAASVAGVDRIFKTGGAQAIGAMAYGTASIPAVDKVTGPGNAFVAAAKKLVSGDCGIDMIAGPSEVCVLADENAIPEFVAVDLMAQAEHDPKATCYLVTTVPEMVPDIEAAIDELIEQSPRAQITRDSLDHGLIVTCERLQQAFDVVNTIAPEHLEIAMSEPWELLGKVKHAGAVFLGSWTPESVGDYVAGPNHTLPTGGTARFSSPLSVDDFVKKSSVISYTYDALEADADAIMTLAAREGLWAHGRAVDVRMAFIKYAMEAMQDGGCGCGCDDPDCDCGGGCGDPDCECGHGDDPNHECSCGK